MTDQELQSWIEQVSLQYFQRPFLHQAAFNTRLRATGGRYFTGSHNIEISRHQLDEHGMAEVEKIIKHELCHYHLHLLRKGYKHANQDFKTLLKQVGGTRFCRSVPGAARRMPYRYRLECVDCKTEYLRKRKVNAAKYVCGKCRGKLKMFQIEI